MGGPLQFKPNLRLFEAITIIVGSMIGSGILLLPADMAELLPSPGLILLVLVAGALLTIVGALTFAELSSMFPRAGGQYHFLKEGLGRFPAYLFGWTQFWVIQTGIVAGVAVAFSRFFKYFVERMGGHMPGHTVQLTSRVAEGPCVTTNADGNCLRHLLQIDPIQIPAWSDAFVAIAVIVLLAFLNMRSTKLGGRVQNVATVAKVAGLAALVFIVFALGTAFGKVAPDAYAARGGGFLPGMDATGLTIAFGGALALSLFAFDGWPQATYVAGEVRNAKRNLPLALTIGPLVTSAIYIALAAAYFYVIPIDQAVDLGVRDARIAPEAAGAVLGTAGRDFISAVALVSVFGTVNGFLLTAPRIFYAFSRDGGLLRSIGTLSRRGTPAWSIYFTAIWASLLVLTGGYQQLVTMVVFGIFLFYIPTSWAHLRMRGVRWLGLPGTHRDAERPYRTPWYPFIPLAFLVASVFVVVSILLTSLAQAMVALGLLSLGIPAYAAQRRYRDGSASAASDAHDAQAGQG
ncbi:MAG: basic amino acid/polyamine antiporter, family [Thermoplasmata archaeon]|jgi:APA family basic amino acid/polyamine antiporter|nr:basic amino acid/polyamine antiporter, family [Thermoplasmata archaeon]